MISASRTVRDAEIMEVSGGTNGESEGFIFERGAVVLELFAEASCSLPAVGNNYNFRTFFLRTRRNCLDGSSRRSIFYRRECVVGRSWEIVSLFARMIFLRH